MASLALRTLPSSKRQCFGHAITSSGCVTQLSNDFHIARGRKPRHLPDMFAAALCFSSSLPFAWSSASRTWSTMLPGCIISRHSPRSRSAGRSTFRAASRSCCRWARCLFRTSFSIRKLTTFHSSHSTSSRPISRWRWSPDSAGCCAEIPASRSSSARAMLGSAFLLLPHENTASWLGEKGLREKRSRAGPRR